MRIAVISDIHDNWTNLDRFCAQIKKLEGIDNVIVCGDIAGKDTLERLADQLPKTHIFAVPGNVLDLEGCKEIARRTKNVTFFDEVGKLQLDGKKIGFIHRPDRASELARSGKYDIVFYGHTHKPWEEKVGNAVLLNPGELTGFFYTPTFCIYDLSKMKAELVLLK